MLLIDAFNHILPRSYHEAVEARVADRSAHASLARYAKAIPALADPTARFRVMDRVEGYVQVLSLVGPAVETMAGPALAAELCRLANDALAELVARHPDRFVAAVATLPLNDPDAALLELDRALGDLRLRGVQIFSDVNGLPLDDPSLFPIYEQLERRNLPVLIHPRKDPALPDYPGEAGSKYRAWTKIGWPVASSLAMLRLVYGGVLERFPKLKILTHHCGGVIPYLAGRLEWNDDFNEMTMGGRDIFLPHPALHYFRRMFYDTANHGNAPALRCGLEFAGGERLVFATDFPFCNQQGLRLIRDAAAAVEALGLDAAGRAAVFSRNAVELFKLPLGTLV